MTNELYGETKRLLPSTTVVSSSGANVTAVEVKVSSSGSGNGTGEDGGEGDATVTMEGVEHLGQYVYEMTMAKVQDLKSRGSGGHELPTREVKMIDAGESVIKVDEEEEDRPENVLIPEEAVNEFGGEVDEDAQA